MNICRYYFLFISTTFFFGDSFAQRVLVDKVSKMVDDQIITQRDIKTFENIDLWLKELFGEASSSQINCIDSEIISKKGHDLKIPFSSSEALHNLEAIKVAVGFGFKSDVEFDLWLQKNKGFTKDQLVENLSKKFYNTRVLMLLKPEFLDVDEEKIESYYNQNPLEKKVSFNLESATLNKEELAKFYKGDFEPEWENIGWMDHSEVKSEIFGLIKGLEKNEISEPLEVKNNLVELIRVIDFKKEKLSLEERRSEILKILKKSSFQGSVSDFISELKDNVVVRELDKIA